MIAGLVWIVPVIQNRRLIVVGMLVLVVGTIFGPAFFSVDGPIQFSLDRVIWFGMLGIAALGWRLGYTQVPKLNRMDWLVIGIVGWFLTSAIMGGHKPTGTPPTARWLFYIAMPAGMYVLARLIEIRARDIRLLLTGSIVLGVYLAVTAVLEITGMHGLVFPRFIADPEVWEFYGRGRGPLLNPSGNGFVMSISFVAAALGFIYAGRRGKLIYAVIAAVILCGVYATLTRSAWLGVVCAFALLVLVYAPRWVRVLGLATAVVIGGASVAGVKDQLIRMKRDKNLTAADAEKSIKLRPLLAVVAWEMFKDKPIVGHGYGHYFTHNDRFHNNRGYELPLGEARTFAQHNVFLSVLVDTGLIGVSMLIAWLAMLVGVGWRLARQRESSTEVRWVGLMLLGALTAYFCNGTFQDATIIPMVHMFLFFLAGVGVTVYQRGLTADLPATAAARASAVVPAVGA
jgi:O-antigen ligase